jgi:hypothetical protein
MRRHLNTPQVVAFIRKQRSAFRAAVCSGNEFVLQEIRDNAENAMARVRAVQVLEGLDEEASLRRPGEVTAPGITIVIREAPIDITPKAPQIIDASE